MNNACRIRVRGRVQGVGFRYFTRLKAGEFGISGFACNMHDGRVYIEAEGEEAGLEQFVEAWREKQLTQRRKDAQLKESRDILNYTQNLFSNDKRYFNLIRPLKTRQNQDAFKVLWSFTFL